MKKLVSYFIVGFLFVNFTTAKPVDVKTAMKVAVVFMQSKGYNQIDNLVDITAQTPFREFYIFAAENGGFVLVSADDCVVPILGYSTSSRFETKDIPAHVHEWLDDYEDGIKFCRENTDDNIEPAWGLYLDGVTPHLELETAVSPLLTTSWNQSPYYNNLCPYDNTYGRRAVTGCVATATAQIMKYWNHPVSGTGSHSYNSLNYGTLSANFNTTYSWSSMPNSLNSSSSSSQVEAVAKLMYHVGVAVEMDYSASSSAAFTFNGCANLRPSTETALMQYFKYRPDMAYIFKSDYTDAQWSSLLRAELDQSRPILYTGRDSESGHAFVCDGYNNNGMFHFNWGWGGYCDGYYTLGALNPSSGGTGGNATYTFNLYNQALLGIRPNTNWSATGTTTVTTTTSGGNSGCTVSGAGNYSYGSTVSLHATSATGYTFTGWSDGCKCNPRQFYANGGSYSFTAQFTGSGGGGGTNYTITTNVNSSTKGAVTGGGSYASGTSLTLTALPKSGYRFDHWQDGNKTNPRTITVTSSASYTAYFVSGCCDTLAYCGNSQYESNHLGKMVRGIKFTPSQLQYRNYLKAVSLYVRHTGVYLIRIYKGGENAPGTLIHTQYASLRSYQYYDRWVDIPLDGLVQIDNTKSLWITIEAYGDLTQFFFPYCQYSGDANGGWFSRDGEAWQQGSVDGTHTWMIKAVTASSAPTPAPPTVTIEYYSFMGLDVAIGTPVPFSAKGTTGGTITWTFQNGTPSMATGSSATSTWNDYSFYPKVIASISNQYGSSSDTIELRLQDCSEPQNADYWLSIFDHDNLLPCWTLLDNDGDGFGWTREDDCVSSYSHLNYYGALTPDNWLITPLLHIPSDNNYYFMWGEREGSIDSYGVYVSTTGNNPENFVLLQNFTPDPSAYYTIDKYWDLSAYRNQDIYIAFRHYNVADGTWISLGTMYIYPGNVYMVSVTSNNNTMGTVTGGGYYPLNRTAIISAKANAGYRFVRWSDGNTQANRAITVTGSTSYIAYFESTNNGVEEARNDIQCQLYPNPTKETATIVIDAVNELVHISLVDLYGHVLTTDEVNCINGCTHQIDVRGLAKGIYFVRINTSSQGIVRKLIVE